MKYFAALTILLSLGLSQVSSAALTCEAAVEKDALPANINISKSVGRAGVDTAEDVYELDTKNNTLTYGTRSWDDGYLTTVPTTESVTIEHLLVKGLLGTEMQILVKSKTGKVLLSAKFDPLFKTVTIDNDSDFHVAVSNSKN